MEMKLLTLMDVHFERFNVFKFTSHSDKLKVSRSPENVEKLMMIKSRG